MEDEPRDWTPARDRQHGVQGLQENHSLRNQQGGDACEHPLVIAGVVIPGRLHPLDGMPIGVRFVGTELADGEKVESLR